MNRLARLLLLPAAALIAAACSTRPDPVLDRESMARLMVDMELADAMCVEQSLGVFQTDSMRLALRSSVLAKHGVNEARLDTSLRWYGAHMPEYSQVIDRADSILADSLRALEREEYLAAAAAAGDSIEMWPMAPSVVFARNQPSDFVSFAIEADSTWERGDLFTLELSLHNARTPLTAALAVDYANRGRTTDAVTTMAYPDDRNKLSLKLQLDSNITAARIYGYLTLPSAPGERAFADSIRLTRTRKVNNDYNQWRRYARRLTRDD